jgi:hypothetical protein
MWMSNGSSPGVNTTAYWRARTHEDWMEGSSYENVFAPPAAATFEAWATAFTAVARAELFFMLDNGWQNGAESTSTELVLHTQRYSQFWTADVNPTQDGTVALRLMRDKIVHEHGWRGLGVWVNGGAAKITAAGFQRLHNASIGLLKYDGGDRKCAMSQLAHIYAPNLIVEHGACVTGCPLNTGSGNGTRSDAASAEQQASTLMLGDSYRTYDTFKVFSTAESLDRNWRVLNASRFANNTRDAKVAKHRAILGAAALLTSASRSGDAFSRCEGASRGEEGRATTPLLRHLRARGAVPRSPRDPPRSRSLSHLTLLPAISADCRLRKSSKRIPRDPAYAKTARTKSLDS